jgi:hypothetical protein
MFPVLNCDASRGNSTEFTADRLITMDEDDLTIPQTEANGRNGGLGWDSREATSEAEQG